MSWDWTYAWDSMPQLLDAFVTTLLATVLSAVLALVLGLVIALVERRGPRSVLARLVGLGANFIRRTPSLIQLYFIFYVGPTLGLTLSALTAGVIALGVHFGTYTAESYRAGIDAVPRGQWDAATALSIPRRQIWIKVVLPQAIPPILAAQGNWVLIIFKSTALLSTITVVELVSAAQQIGSDHLAYLEPTVLVGIFFLAVSYPASVLLRIYERRISQHR
ncbi:ectoine/hydroxyectoine ABC transporter permease subunit EhuD [Micromonospora echinospora]|uniref:Polar amino acid transport system permease protein n=1 Tax=Micromonospora echinospora TaxID=1877 RepID=A0A1C5A532_MICEC|nr:ectoine/hydroxyectoine ABC transporter permease subunit EhuD [Micromonospora echinospora]OZV75363.1 ectoine/hydroxyectoine ABC transporter permease subunit EhuD [Micromonospora echinospora]SCF40320.1 polar amino acid transport system permease protein [Micromonospora echinospora]